MTPRIAYLLKKFPRLSETFVLNEILAQERLGKDIHVFSRRPKDDEPSHPQLRQLEADVETLPSRREIDPWSTLFSAEWGTRELFDELGRLVHEAKEWGHPRFPSLLVEALVLLRRTSELGIGHVHAHFATDSAFVAMLLHVLGGPTYSITAHAKDIYRTTTSTALLNRMFAGAEFVVTVCDANVDYLRERLAPDALAKVRRLYNGIDLGTFRMSTEPRDASHILSVGRLVEKKGFFVLLDALAELRARGLEFRASIVGQGEEEARIRARVDELGLADRVRMHGPLDQGAVRELMNTCTVMCLPCIVGEDGNRDALPTVLLEALACGLPCVSTPVTGIPEILAHGAAGAIVPQSDPTATADALAELLEDPTGRERIARAGREHAEELFDADGVARVLGAWFDEALSAEEARCASRV